MEYLGKLHQAAVEFPQTDIWMDSCGEEELEYGLKRGIVGATSNPIIVGNVIKNELNIWEKRIKEMVVEMKDASEEDIAWELIYEIGALRSKKLLPVFEANKGKKGRLSLQVNAKYYRNKDKMVEQAALLQAIKYIIGKAFMLIFPVKQTILYLKCIHRNRPLPEMCIRDSNKAPYFKIIKARLRKRQKRRSIFFH